jgi:hypothetical protein
MLHAQPMVAGPATNREHLQWVEQLGSAAVGFGSSAVEHSSAFYVASTKNKGIRVVFDTQNSSSPTVVTRQFSSNSMTPIKDLQGRTMKNPLVHDVAAFGGIASPSVSIRASDRIRAQPNADAT